MIQMVANVVLIGASVRMILQVARYRVTTPRIVQPVRHSRSGRAVATVRRPLRVRGPAGGTRASRPRRAVSRARRAARQH